MQHLSIYILKEYKTFPFYANLNDNSSAGNCRDISKQRARVVSAPPKS